MIDLTGKIVGHLTVIGYSHIYTQPCGARVHYWKVKCACGKEFVRKSTHLTSKKIKNPQSCGCAIPEQVSKRAKTHGLKNNRSYSTWINMIRRCENPTDAAFQHYGGRGIKVCEPWKSVEKFIEDMGERPVGFSIERIDVNKGYYKENCRWIPKIEQPRNARSNIKITANGETLILTDWAKRLNTRAAAIRHRLACGWSPQEAVTLPLRTRVNDYRNKG